MDDDRDIFTSNIFPKEFVEGAIAECIAQIKYSLDVVTKDINKVNKLDSIKGSFLIAASEAGNLIKMLEHYTDASLNRKHMLARYLLKSFVKKLQAIEDILDAKRMHKKEVLEFGRIVTTFLVSLHTVMLEDTKPALREVFVSEFCGDDLCEYGVHIGKVITIH